MKKAEREQLEIELTHEYIRVTRNWLKHASSDEFSDGMQWYSREANNIRNIGSYLGFRFEPAAAAAAALSPGCPWDRNLIDLQMVGLYVANDGKLDVSNEQLPACVTYKQNVRKACEILMTGNPELLSGQKVIEFYRSFLAPKTHMTPCVDRWMLKSVGLDRQFRVHERRAFYNAYTRLAYEYDLSSAQIQAIVWIVVRNIFDSSGVK